MGGALLFDIQTQLLVLFSGPRLINGLFTHITMGKFSKAFGLCCTCVNTYFVQKTD